MEWITVLVLIGVIVLAILFFFAPLQLYKIKGELETIRKILEYWDKERQTRAK